MRGLAERHEARGTQGHVPEVWLRCRSPCQAGQDQSISGEDPPDATDERPVLLEPRIPGQEQVQLRLGLGGKDMDGGHLERRAFGGNGSSKDRLDPDPDQFQRQLS